MYKLRLLLRLPVLSLQIATGVTSTQPIKLVQVPQTTTYIPTTQPTIVSTASSFKVCSNAVPGIKIAQYLWGVVSVCCCIKRWIHWYSLNLQCKMFYFAVQHSTVSFHLWLQDLEIFKSGKGTEDRQRPFHITGLFHVYTWPQHQCKYIEFI